MMRRGLKASIDINASPEAVWQTLMDFAHYREWSTFLLNVEGPAVPGSCVRITLSMANGRPRAFKPMVLQATPPRVFRWLGHLGVPGLFDGEHGFFLEYLFGGGTRLRQTLEFGGFLTPFLWHRIESPMAQGLADFNRALKKRVESQH